jgi:hypothetical protein
MMTTTMTNFTGLSAVLTGFNESVIAPPLDPIDIKTAYLTEWQNKVSAETGKADLANQILAAYADLQTQSHQVIGEVLLANSDYELPCRQLIFLWYMGAWPTISEADNAQHGMTSFDSLSSDAYTSGLVWKVMQAHPMGDSNDRYGYWGNTPAALSDFTGNRGN